MGVATMANNNKNTILTFMGSAEQFEAYLSQFFLLISTDWLCWRAILVVTTTTDRQTDYFTPVQARGVIS